MRAFLPVIVLLFTGFAAADFESASAAYRNQQYGIAFSQFSELAEAGDARAQAVLAIMYKYGESVPVNPAKAYDWYLRAAQQGYPPAQYNVGIMLADGLGTPPDQQQALQWLQAAADAGYERASERIATLTGGPALATISDEPVAWSQSWNLRLPNSIRYQQDAPVDLALKVYRVQLGAMRSITAAESLWRRLAETSPAFFADYQPIYREAQVNGRRIYRLQVGPFNEQGDADSFCVEYAYRIRDTAGCVVLQTN